MLNGCTAQGEGKISRSTGLVLVRPSAFRKQITAPRAGAGSSELGGCGNRAEGEDSERGRHDAATFVLTFRALLLAFEVPL